MRGFWKRDGDLEARLREHRSEPRAEFFLGLSDRLTRRRPLRRLQIAVAASLTICALAVFAAAGGVGYTSSSVGSLATSLTSSQSGHNGDNNKGDDKKKKKKKECDDKKTPAGKQYCEDDDDNDDHGGGNGGGGNNGGNNGH